MLLERYNLATNDTEIVSDAWGDECGIHFHPHAKGDVTCFCGRYPTAIGYRQGLQPHHARGPQSMWRELAEQYERARAEAEMLYSRSPFTPPVFR